jgi:hypothetical protein
MNYWNVFIYMDNKNLDSFTIKEVIKSFKI